VAPWRTHSACRAGTPASAGAQLTVVVAVAELLVAEGS
jgi:hypothetical protein